MTGRCLRCTPGRFGGACNAASVDRGAGFAARVSSGAAFGVAVRVGSADVGSGVGAAVLAVCGERLRDRGCRGVGVVSWSTEVKQGLPDGLWCVHVLKDGKRYGFAMRGSSTLNPTFESEDDAAEAAEEAERLLADGDTGSDTLTVVKLR